MRMPSPSLLLLPKSYNSHDHCCLPGHPKGTSFAASSEPTRNRLSDSCVCLRLTEGALPLRAVCKLNGANDDG